MTKHPSALTNAEIDQLMAPVIVRVSRWERQYVPAQFVKNEVLAMRHRNRISLEWKPARTWSKMKVDTPTIEVEQIDAPDPATVVLHPNYQNWVCFILNHHVFLGRMWEFRRDL